MFGKPPPQRALCKLNGITFRVHSIIWQFIRELGFYCTRFSQNNELHKYSLCKSDWMLRIYCCFRDMSNRVADRAAAFDDRERAGKYRA